MIQVGDIVKYEHPVTFRGKLSCGRVLAVDERFVTVDGECNGLRMAVRVRLDKAKPDEQMMRILRRAKA